MTATETIATLNDISEVIGMFVSMWVSVTFAYLTVAYFVGAALSRFQCLVISGLYTLTAVYFASAGIAHVQAWHLVRESGPTLYDQIALMQSQTAWAWGITLFHVGGTLVSLYFMYNVRQSKNKLEQQFDD
ncbi:MAG: hypothetical protein ACU84Q_01505 [Gammaproteobacteria bacterium]